MQITIFEENGFTKQIKIDKAVTRIGSSPASDVQLRSPNVSSFHLQILYTQDTPDRCKVLNLATETASLHANGLEKSLAPYVTAEAFAGDELHLKGFRLRFDLPLTSGTLSSSQKISASISLPEPVLRPKATLLGRISLKNEGDNNSCQFDVEISGFPENCFQIDPVPLIYAGGQEDVNIRFFHRQTHPEAGFQSVTISVTAPSSYPGEQVIIQQGIYIAPMLEQGLVIHDDTPEPLPITPVVESASQSSDQEVSETITTPPKTIETLAMVELAAQPETAPITTKPAPVPVADPAPGSEKSAEEPVLGGAENETPDQKPAPAARPLPANPKVVRTPAESFWDE